MDGLGKYLSSKVLAEYMQHPIPQRKEGRDGRRGFTDKEILKYAHKLACGL